MPFSFKPLWRLLQEKEMNKTQFRAELGISPATLAKMSKGEYISLEILDKICSHFNVQPNDIIEHKVGDEDASI